MQTDGRRMNRWTNLTKLIVTFCNFVNAPKIKYNNWSEGSCLLSVV